MLSEKDARKLGSVVEANRRHLLHDICAIFNALRPQTVSKRKIQRQICEENFNKWSKKKIQIRAKNVKEGLEGCKLNR